MRPPLDWRVSIAPGADLSDVDAAWEWVDISQRRRQREHIAISTGGADEFDQAPAGSCSLVLDNTDGPFVTRNPVAPWYPSLQCNTPLRVALRRAVDTFARTAADDWGTSEGTFPELWAKVGSGGSVLNADWQVSGGAATHRVPATNAYRLSWLSDVELLDVDAAVTVQLAITNVSGAPLEPANVLLRMQDTSTWYMARVEIETDESVTASLHVTGVGELASATVPGLTHSASQALRVRAVIEGSHLRMRVWAAAGDEPAAWHVLATDATIATPGGVGVRSGVAAANSNTLPIMFSYTDFTLDVDRFVGPVPAWSPRWDKSGRDATTPVAARGPLYRLGQGTPPVRSPLRRAVLAAARTTPLLAYWPLEDDADATSAASGIPGQPPMVVAGAVEFALIDPAQSRGNTNRYGTGQLPGLGAGGALTGQVPAGTSTPVEWAVQAGVNSDAFEAGEAILIASWTTVGGTHTRWELWQTGPADGDDTAVFAYAADGTRVTVIRDGTTFLGFFEYVVTSRQVGADIEVQLRIGGFTQGDIAPGGASPWTATLAGATSGRVDVIRANPDRNAIADSAAFTVGHLQVWDSADPPPFEWDAIGGLSIDPWLAFRGESVHDRITRHAAEDRLTFDCPPVAAEFETLAGAQPDAAPLDLYRQCEEADLGVIVEQGAGIRYVPRQHRYNRAVGLALDYTLGNVADPPDPTDDDQGMRNRWTVSRAGGSSAESEDIEHQRTRGGVVYGDSVEVNVSVDTVLPQHAAWRVHLGTAPELRWPLISWNLLHPNGSALVDAWLNCRPQSRLTVANPPDGMRGDPIDVVIEGYNETCGQYTWEVAANCMPAGPWQVAVIEGVGGVTSPPWRLDSGDSQLASGITDTATALSVATSAGPLLSLSAVNPGDYPVDVEIGGERMSVTAVTGGASPQSATVTRSVNGVVKAHLAGAPVRLWRPPGIAL